MTFSLAGGNYPSSIGFFPMSYIPVYSRGPDCANPLTWNTNTQWSKILQVVKCWVNLDQEFLLIQVNSSGSSGCCHRGLLVRSKTGEANQKKWPIAWRCGDAGRDARQHPDLKLLVSSTRMTIHDIEVAMSPDPFVNPPNPNVNLSNASLKQDPSLPILFLEYRAVFVAKWILRWGSCWPWCERVSERVRGVCGCYCSGPHWLDGPCDGWQWNNGS